MKSYSAKLRDPRWQRKRLELLHSARWKCDECSSEERELNVHHYWYESGKDPWDYPRKCYAVLCDICHNAWHASKLHCDKSIAGLNLLQLDQVHGLIAGLKCAVEHEDYEFGRHSDTMFIASFVRGFWAPHGYQKGLLDECLLQASRGEPFLFSSVVSGVIPDRAEYAYIRCWIDAVTNAEGAYR